MSRNFYLLSLYYTGEVYTYSDAVKVKSVVAAYILLDFYRRKLLFEREKYEMIAIFNIIICC